MSEAIQNDPAASAVGANEQALHDALDAVLPAFHLALDGKPEAGIAYRMSGERAVYESDVPIMTFENFQVYVYQREYDPQVVEAVRAAARNAGFEVAPIAGQIMQEDYYRDELRMTKQKQEG